MTAVFLIIFAGIVIFGLPFLDSYMSLKNRAQNVVEDEQQVRRSMAKWREVLKKLSSFDQKQSLALLEELLEKYKRLDQVLNSKFSDNELVSSRYRVIADEVRLGVLKNLERQLELLEAVKHINKTRIEDRINTLMPGSDATIELEKALYDRLSLLGDVDKRIARMTTANELALNALDKAIVALADLDTNTKNDTSKLEASVAELEEMIAGAHRYGARTDDVGLEPSRKKRKKTIELSG